MADWISAAAAVFAAASPIVIYLIIISLRYGRADEQITSLTKRADSAHNERAAHAKAHAETDRRVVEQGAMLTQILQRGDRILKGQDEIRGDVKELRADVGGVSERITAVEAEVRANGHNHHHRSST